MFQKGRVVSRRVITIADHDPSWPERFFSERDRLAVAFAASGVADEVIGVEHIGSTAVPGLAAKPIIDILVGLRRWPASPDLLATVERVGYAHLGEMGIAGRHFFIDGEPGGMRTRHLHAVAHGGRFWRDHLMFRDALRRDPSACAAYAALKCDLARTHPHDSVAYTDGKTAFVCELLQGVRADAGDSPAHAAASGFDTDPERYERSRPGYPPEAIAYLAARLELGPGVRVADLGAGTGKLTRPLLEAGADVVAVDPSPAMCHHLAARLPGVTVWSATAEELPAPRAAFDALAAGQAFDWFEPYAALSEAYRVLRPGGRFALVWNLRDESVSWVGHWSEIVDRVAGGVPRAREQRWRDVVAATELFALRQTHAFPNVHRVPREAVVDRLASTSALAALDAATRQPLLEEFRSVLDTDRETRGRDEIAVPYRTEVNVHDRVS